MKNNSRPCRLRLSPNELQNLLKQERDKWRIFRIQQVREQAKEEARRVRETVHAEEKKMIALLSREVQQQWEEEKEKKVAHLEKEYQDCMMNIGQAHRLAAQQPDPSKVLQQQTQQNRRLAMLRGQEASRQQQEELKQQQHTQNTHLRQRQEALHWEKLRASHMASLPLPEAFRKKTVVKEKPQQSVAFHEAGTFTTTHYLPQNVRVEKEVWSSRPNAKETAAAEEAERERMERKRRKQTEQDYLKREQRGKEALRKEQVTRLLQDLTARLDEAQTQHLLSHFLNGKDGTVMENRESFLKAHQQKKMEEAVQELLQKEMEGKEREKEEHIIPDSIQLSSDGLEEIESPDSNGGETVTATKVRGLQSFLKEVESRRRRILQELQDSDPVRDSMTDGDAGDVNSPGSTARDIHLADTVPVHLYPGHQPTRTPCEDSTASQPPQSSSPQSEESTTELPDSSSTVLPLSEESIPLSIDITQPSIDSSLSDRCSTPAQTKDTNDKQQSLAKTHQITSYTSSCSSEEHRNKGDLDVGSSSPVSSDSKFDQEQPREQQAESHVSSTEYYSPPSELPCRHLSLQEIENNLKRIQENRQHSWNLLNHLSWKRGFPGSHTPITTYLEKLKEEGSGKKPIRRKEKFERQKRELIQFYLQRLLQREDHEGDLSASTVEGSSLSVSSLGFLLSYMEGEKEKDQITDLPSSSASATSPSRTSWSLSAYEDIDEFPVRMTSREHVQLPSHTTTPAAVHSIHTHPPYTATSVVAPAAFPSSSTSSSYSSPQLQHPLSSSSSSTHPSHYSSKPCMHPHHSTSTSRQKQEVSSRSFISTTEGSSINRSPEQMSTKNDGSQKQSSSSCLSPISEAESSVKEYETASEHGTTTTTITKQTERLKLYRTRRLRQTPHHQEEITTSSGDSPKDVTTKLPKLSKSRQYESCGFSLTNITKNQPLFSHSSGATTRETTNSSSGSLGTNLSSYRCTKTKLSEISGTEMSSIHSLECDESSCIPAVTSVTTVQTNTTVTTPTTPSSQPSNFSHSSEESSISMPDMREVLRRFGLERAISKSFSATPSSEEVTGD